MKVEAFHAMAKAIIYEPVVEQDSDKEKEYNYIFDSPYNLSSYLITFMHPSKQKSNVLPGL